MAEPGAEDGGQPIPVRQTGLVAELAALAAPQAFATSSASARVAPSRLAAMNPAQNASPAPTGSTRLGSGTAGRTYAVVGIGALDRQGPVGGHLDDRGRRAEGQRGASQLGRGRRSSRRR